MRGKSMNRPYDIFRKAPDGSKMWLAAVDSLREAEMYLRELQQAGPCEYYVCDLSARKVVAVIKPDSLGLTSAVPSPEESFFLETAGAA
jgi:hypothetical protein